MQRHSFSATVSRAHLAALISLIFLLAGAATAAPPVGPASPSTVDATKRLQLFPLAFERNEGQADPAAKYVARGAGYSLLLMPGETVLNVGRKDTFEQIRLKFDGADAAAQASGQDRLPTIVNYIIGNDRSLWHTNIATFGKVTYRRLYPGIDLLFYGNQGRLEHDFVVGPGADPRRIALEVAGAQRVSINAHGDLILRTRSGELQLLKPIAYQVIAGHRREVASRFQLRNGNRIGFVLGNYDRGSELIIDPVLNWNTYLFGTNSNSTTVAGVALDSSQAVYVAGNTTASSFNGNTPSGGNKQGAASGTKIFIARIDDTSTGSSVSGSTLTWLTFIGGSGVDTASNIALDNSHVFVVGQTSSTSSFPVSTNGFLQSFSTAPSTSGFVAAVPQSNGAALSYGSFVGENNASSDANATAAVIKGATAPYDITTGADLYVAGWVTNGGGVLSTSAGYQSANFSKGIGGFVVQLSTAFPATGGASTFPAGAIIYGSYFVSNQNATDAFQIYGLGVGQNQASSLPAWAASTNFSGGNLIRPTTNNTANDIYMDTTGGSHSTGSSQPNWNTKPNLGDTVTDGGITWVNIGPFLGNIHIAGAALGEVPQFNASGTSCNIGSGTPIDGVEGFVFKLDMTKIGCAQLGNTSSGYGTFLGANSQVSALAIDGNSPANAYVTGYTAATSGFATSAPTGLSSTLHDTTVSVASGSITAHTTNATITTSAAHNFSVGQVVSVSGTGSTDFDGIWTITGTTSTTFSFTSITKAGASNITIGAGGKAVGTFDAFAAKISGTGTKTWAGYLGGTGNDYGNAIALQLDQTQNPPANALAVAIAGTTQSSDLTQANPLLNPQTGAAVAFGGTQAGFLTLIDQHSSPAVSLSSYFGGSGKENGKAVALVQNPASGAVAYFGGDTTSLDLPINSTAFQAGPATAFTASNTAGFVGEASEVNVAATPAATPLAVAASTPDIGQGAAIKYTFTFTGASPSNTYTTFDAKMPVDGSGNPFLSISAVTPSSGTCKFGTAGVTCQLGSIAAAATATIEIDATGTAATACAAMPCTPASFIVKGVVAAAENSNLGTASTTTNIVPGANLTVTLSKAATTEPVHPATTATGSVILDTTISSAGPVTVTAGNLVYTLTFPADFVPDTLSKGATPADWGTCDTLTGAIMAKVSCTSAADLANAASLSTIRITGHFDDSIVIPAGGPQNYTFTPSVALTGFTDTGATPATVLVSAERASDLTAATTDNTTTAIRLSDPLVFTSTVTNNGPDNATNVSVAYTLPGGVVPTQVQSTVFDSCVQASNVITCKFNALLAGSGNAKIGTLTLTPPATGWPLSATVSTGTMATGIAVSSTDVVETVPANNSQTVNSNLARTSDLQLTTLADNSATTPVSLAGPLTLTAQVKNAGPDDATSVIVHFTLTDGGNNAYTLGTNSFPSGCSAATNVITCTVGALTNGTTGSYSVQVNPDPAWVSATSNVGTISTVADTASPDVVDDGAAGAPGTNNTSSSLTNHLARTSDLQMSSYTDNTQVTPVSESGTLTLTANLKNAGPDDAIDAVVTFTLTAGSSSYTLGTSTFPSGCINAALTITCTVGPIAKNATPSYSVNLTPDAAWVGASSKTGTITSLAQISSPHVYDNGTSGAAGANNSSTTLTTNISRQADLRTTAVVDNTSVTPVNLTGTLVITPTIANFGPDDANGNIVVQVTFPTSNYTINNGSTTFNGGCVKDGATPAIADCTVNGSLANGANLSYNLAVTPDPAWLSTSAATGTITPSVKVSSSSVYDDGTSGAPGANNTKTVTTHLERLADLQLTNLTDNSTINPVPLAAPPVGPGLKYITSIKNVGPDTAENVKVVYTLPTAAYTFSSTTLGTCVQATTTLTCTIGQLTTAAGTVSFTVTVAPDPAAIATTANPPTASVSTSGQVQSSAVVDDGAAGAPGANNNGSVNSALERQSDLRIGTMTDNSPVSLAGTLTMTTPIQNLGPDAAPNVSVAFTLPNSAYTYTTNSGYTTCNQTGAVVTCTLTSLARNVSTPTSTSISVTPDPAAVPANAPSATATTNTQISSLNTADTNNVNDTGSDMATIARKSDLQITSLTDNTSSANPVSLAGTLTYTVNVKNAGPDDATGVKVAFTLPTSGFTYLTNSGFGSCAQAAAVITCQISGTVANAATPSFTLSVTPDPASATTSVPPTVVSTSATVSSTVVVDDGTSGAPGANNTATRNSNIARRSDLEFVSLTDNSTATNPVPLGGPLTFATQIKNFGPDDAIGVVVKYTVPSGFTYSTSTGYTGCSQTSTLITCTVGGTIANGSSPSFSMTTVPGATAIATTVKSATAGITAVVSSTQVFDDGTSGNPNPANNNAADTANLARRSDLQVISFTDNSPVGDAGPLILTAKIQNVNTAGFGDDAVSVDVVFTLANSNFTAIGNSGFSSCSPQSGSTVTCHFGSLTVAAGAVNVSLSVTPQSLASGGPIAPVTNVQVQSADVWDDTPNTGAPSANNDAQVTSSIQSVVHLSFTHTSNPTVGTFANLAQPVKYTIQIHNATTTTGGAATSAAQGVVVTENLPSTFISRAVDASSTAGWSCNFAASPVSCSLSGLIAPGSTSANDAILVISGVYTDDPALLQLPGGGAYAPGTGNSGNITATLSTTSTDPDGFSPIDTSTDLRRLVALGATAASNPAAGSGTLARLGTDVVYTIVVSNPSTLALPTDTATAVYLDVAIPANFIGVSIDAASTAGWTCVPANFSSSPTRCTQANPLPPNTTQTLVLRGQYSDSTAQSTLTGGLGTAGISATPGVTASVQAASVPIVPAVANTDIQRLIHLTATAASSPAAGVSFANLQAPVVYTFNVSNAATVNSVATDSAAGVVLYVTLPATFINPAVTSANWDCAGFAANPAPCSFSGSIPSGGTAATPLVITGEYSNATAVLPGGGAYAPGTGNAGVNANLTATLSQDPAPGSVATSTDIRRDVQLTITQAQPTANPVSLGAAESYTVRVSNAPGSNDAAGVVVADTLPSGFNLTSASGTGWSCGGNVSGVVTCTVTGTIVGGATSNDLVISGSYDKSISLAGSGTGTRTNSAAVSATLSFDEPGTAKTASMDTTIQRNVNLGVSMTAAPNPIGAGGAASNVVTYTVNVNNTGVDPVSGSTSSVKVDFTAPLPSNFTNLTASGSGSSTVTCDTTTNYPHVICTYPSQDTTPTVITIKGQFDQTTVAGTGSALAQASVAVSTADGIDSDANNNSASSTVTVVDTPAGANIVPLLSSSGHPVTVTYSTVTQAGITTQAVTQLPPTGFHEPAIDYPAIDYSTALPYYFVIASDPAAPVAFNTPTTVCVAYTTLAGVTFTKPERVRFFDATGKDITSYLDAATVCGKTANPGPNLGSFTVREPRNHAPVAKAAAQQLFSGKIGTNQFTLDSSGTTDADIQQICNGSPTPPAAGSQFCGDTLTYTWTGPPGMNAGNGSNTFTQVVKANADGTLGAPAQVTGSFPLGISTVTLTVTDQTGASSTSQVSVSVNSFTLSTTNQSAVITPGQSTSFQVIPQDANKQPLQFNGNMTLTCSGVRNADSSSLATNHITCSVSPNVIQQGQFSTALIVTVGPNFSQARPVGGPAGALGGPPNPTLVGWGISRSGGALAMFLALMSPALMGIVVLPGRGRRWKTLLILALLLAGLGLQLGCGGTGNTPTAQTIPVTTPAGTYTITITGTAAGGVTSTNTFTLTVQ